MHFFGYQKASGKQVENVSKVLAPVNDARKLRENQPIEKCRESETSTQVLEDLPNFDLQLSEDILASIPMLETVQ